MELKDTLREAIRSSGRSLTQLGEATGVDAGRLSRFLATEEEKHRDLTIEAYAAVGEELGLILEWRQVAVAGVPVKMKKRK